MGYQIPFSNPEENISATVSYFDLFDYPLTLSEIQKFLLGSYLQEDEIKRILNENVKIEEQNGFYFLSGHEEILKTRMIRSEISKKLWQKVKRFLPVLQLVPFIKMIAICNTLAFDNANKESDIDLFIVTKKNRIFLTRTLATLLFSLIGIRRHGNKVAGRFCLSFYVTEEGLNLEKIKLEQDIYLLYWIKLLKPVFGIETYQEFQKQNTWVNSYFEKKEREIEQDKFIPIIPFFQIVAKIQEFLLRGNLGNYLEKKIKSIQQKRHAKRLDTLGLKASVIINETMLKFHNVDRREEFKERFQKNLANLLKGK